MALRSGKAAELVGLDPSDCFALATYKIYQGLQKQEEEVLPYLFAGKKTGSVCTLVLLTGDPEEGEHSRSGGSTGGVSEEGRIGWIFGSD